ncbi:hypothetical protein CGRA01v4_03587 [Colletotrichum graminicola]|nr:hypothetical protein CGRA01v4_03587 [Colletotrichum graminicola]
MIVSAAAELVARRYCRSKWPRTTEGCSTKAREPTDSDIVSGPFQSPTTARGYQGLLRVYWCFGKTVKRHGRFKLDGQLTVLAWDSLVVVQDGHQWSGRLRGIVVLGCRMP